MRFEPDAYLRTLARQPMIAREASDATGAEQAARAHAAELNSLQAYGRRGIRGQNRQEAKQQPSRVNTAYRFARAMAALTARAPRPNRAIAAGRPGAVEAPCSVGARSASTRSRRCAFTRPGARLAQPKPLSLPAKRSAPRPAPPRSLQLCRRRGRLFLKPCAPAAPPSR
jgi:hypothetical protein